MGLLRTKERTPQEEALRQAEIANEIQRQHDAEMQRQRDLTAQNARRREQLWQEQAQAVEDRRMALMARELEVKREREERQREQQAKLNETRMAEYRAAVKEVENIDRALTQLNVPHDLSTIEGALAASEQHAKVAALRELREKADGRLLLAERAVGRHRNGGY